MKPVIGLDFGNFNTFPCFISDFDEGTRMGGIVHDLLPAREQEGIPSVYFYSKKAGQLCGEAAVRRGAVPLQNRLRYLKRHIGEKTTLDDKEISYDDAITEVIQHCVRRANKELQNGWQVTTNLVSLSYPVTYTCSKRQRLIELAERATLEDGTRIKVCGTIAEPAAAALDYLAEFAKSDRDTTVLTYDMGGGTFDLGLVSAYPRGRRDEEGKIYYYDIVGMGGIGDLGGAEFDDIMVELLRSKVKVQLNREDMAALRNIAEEMKVHLSTSPEDVDQLLTGEGYIELSVTRDEFEKASRELLMRTIEETRNLLRDHQNQKPELILLTGGASQMPMVQRELDRAFPEYRGRIINFRPSKAIAYGAARFGTAERQTDPVLSESIVQQRVIHDIGVWYFNDDKDKKGHIETFIPAGTPIPCVSESVYAERTSVGRFSQLEVYEANRQDPSEDEVKRDYTQIMSVKIDHGRAVPEGYKTEARMRVDRLGILTIEARGISEPGLPFEKAQVQLRNLS